MLADTNGNETVLKQNIYICFSRLEFALLIVRGGRSYKIRQWGLYFSFLEVLNNLGLYDWDSILIIIIFLIVDDYKGKIV